MPSFPVLSQERTAELREAVHDWYRVQEKKTVACLRVGSEIKIIGALVSGVKKLLPPVVMAKLWQETQNSVFLMTRDEQQNYRRFMGRRFRDNLWPSEAEWPLRESGAPIIATSLRPPRRPPPRQSPGQTTDCSRTVVESLTGLEDLECLLKLTNRQLGRLAGLPADDPRRQAAQRRLPSLVMISYLNALALSLPFPEEFTDLLSQFDLAISAFNGGKNS